MSGDWFRRNVLTTVGVALTASVGGCSALEDSERLAHYVDIFNYRDTNHTLKIQIENADGERLYTHEGTLEANTATEKTDVFTGSPDTITLRIDNMEPISRPWPDTDCRGDGKVSAGGIDLYLEPEGDLLIQPECDTVYID